MFSGGCSCTGESQRHNDTIDTSAVTPSNVLNAPQQQVLEATGLVVDGAMNSVSLKAEGSDELLEFAYPDLPPEKRVEYSLDDSTFITVRYVKVRHGDVEEDSVVEMVKATHKR